MRQKTTSQWQTTLEEAGVPHAPLWDYAEVYSQQQAEERGFRVTVRDRADKVHPALQSPDDLLVVAAGGPAGGFGAVIAPWMGSKTRAVTAAIGACVDCEPPKR